MPYGRRRPVPGAGLDRRGRLDHLKLVFSGRDRGPESGRATVHVHMETIDLRNAEAVAVTGGQIDSLQGLLKAAAKPVDFIVGPVTWTALIEDKS